MLSFDLTPHEEVIKIGDTEYTIREATVEIANKWRNAEAACYFYAPDGSISQIKGMADTVPLLVGLCLVNGDGKSAVSQATIKSWPDHVVQAVYKRVKEVSNLDRATSLEDMLKAKQNLEERIANKQKEEEERKKLLSSISAS